MMKCVVTYRRYKIVCNMRTFKYSLSWEKEQSRSDPGIIYLIL